MEKGLNDQMNATEHKTGIFSEYAWSESKTQAHKYLLRTLMKILNELSLPNSSLILDAGCGGGYVTNQLIKWGYKNIYGFDISKSGIEIATKNFPEISDKFRIHDGYERKLPEGFPRGSYDLILSSEVIEHLFEPKVYLENLHHWLSGDGFLVLTTPYHGYLKNLAISLFNRFDSHFHPLVSGGHIKFFSKDTLYKLLHEAHFQPLAFLGSGRLPYLWKSMVVVAKRMGN